MTANKKLNNALIKAAKEGDLVNIKLLIRQGADIHTDNDDALRWSAYNGHLEIVKYLVENGANIYADNDAALYLATESGHLKVAKYLINIGENKYIKNDEVLKWSAENGHFQVAKYIIIDYNIDIKKETLDYLKENNLSEIINLINIRDLHNNLNNSLNCNQENNKIKLKV